MLESEFDTAQLLQAHVRRIHKHLIECVEFMDHFELIVHSNNCFHSLID